MNAKTDDLVPLGTLIDWRAKRLNVRAYDGMWALNPSVHYDGTTWRCSVRCADYGMPDGRLIRGVYADDRGVQSHNLMLHLDPDSWAPTEVFPMKEAHDYPLSDAGNRGFEDLRLFWTESADEPEGYGLSGLQAIAASAHLWRSDDQRAFPPEQVLLQLDAEYSIVGARPIRGESWAGPQKNWVPFDRVSEPRFLYSIDRGIVYGPDGPIEDDEAQSDADEPAGPPAIGMQTSRLSGDGWDEVYGETWDQAAAELRSKPVAVLPPARRILPPGGAEFRAVQRPTALDARRFTIKDTVGLRGGGQLQHVEEHDIWLGIGHEMRIGNNRKKLYWHRFYACNNNGVLIAKSRAFKLAPQEGIEFAAGMALDGERLVISYGVDDALCRIGEAKLPAVLGLLEEVKPEPRPAPTLTKKPAAKSFSTHEPLTRRPFGQRPKAP